MNPVIVFFFFLFLYQTYGYVSSTFSFSSGSLCRKEKSLHITALPPTSIESGGPIGLTKTSLKKVQNAACIISLLGASYFIGGPLMPAMASEVITRSEVGFIDLNETNVEITDVVWLDIAIGDSPPQRLEIGLFGTVTPKTAENFKSLCTNSPGFGYKNSDIFRIISSFSVQGGQIGYPEDEPKSYIGKYGKSASTGTNLPKHDPG